MRFSNNNTERMRINSSGNVGIGTDSPVAKLEVHASSLGQDGLDIYNSLGNRTINIGHLGGGQSYMTLSDELGATKILLRSEGGASYFNTGENFGIGTNTPSAKVQIKMSNDSLLSFDNAGSISSAIRCDGSIAFESDTNFIFRDEDGTNERMRIDTSGDVLVGTTSNDPRNFSGSTYGVKINDNQCEFAQTTMFINRASSTDGDVIVFRRNGTSVGSISVNAVSTSYNTSSDYRLKENVVPMEGALDRVNALKPSRFNFIADPEKTVDGFLAHEAAEVVPEAVTGEKDAVDEDGNPEYQGIDQSKLVPLLVGAIQELRSENNSLKERLDALERQ